MNRPGKGIAARLAPSALALAIALAACSGGSADPPTPTPRVRTTLTPTIVVIGTEAVARWAAVWKGAFQQMADDLSAIVQAIRNRDVAALRDPLGRLPRDAHEALRKLDQAGAAPPGMGDEVRHLRALVGQAAGLAPRIAGDCLDQAGLACAADAATFLSVVGRMLDALKPFGVNVNFRVEL